MASHKGSHSRQHKVSHLHVCSKLDTEQPDIQKTNRDCLTFTWNKYIKMNKKIQ